jgi:hypothetical protein
MTSVLFHVGLQKTGSTLIQRNLNRNRGKLAEVGAAYYRLRPATETDAIEHLPHFTSLLRTISTNRHPDPSEAELAREMRTVRESSTVILSDENTLGPIAHENGKPAYGNARAVMERAVEALDLDDMTAMLYVRAQDTYLESTYMQRIHNGRSIRFPEFIEGAAIDSFDWHSLADAVASAVGKENMRVVPYESIREGEVPYLNHVLETAGLDVRLTEDDMARRESNRSYSALGLEIALRCNDLLEGEDLKAFRKFLQTEFSNASHPRAELLSEDARRDLLERYRPSNERLFDEYGITAHRDRYGLA